MKLFGFEWRRKVPVPSVTTPVGWSFNSPWDWLNNWPVVQEPFTGAWQKNQELRLETVLTYYAVYACINLIAGDIGKLTLKLVEKIKDNVFRDVDVPAFSPVLRIPNRYQTRQQFLEGWMVSKLTNGNTYILKERDERNIVVAMHILHPGLVNPMVAELDGSIWYSVGTDPLAGLDKTDIVIPESEIIHDRFPPLNGGPFYGGHRLCGVSPLTACGLAALQGLNIQRMSNRFFSNGARPSGVLTVPPEIPEETARQYKDKWEANYSQAHIGKVAVLGGGMKYEPIAMMTSQDAQLVEQLKMTADMVCTAFGVPPHKIMSVQSMPNYSNIEALDQGYYSGCLQKLIEAVESCLDKGLGLETNMLPYETRLNLDDLLKMDTQTKVKTWGEAVKGMLTPNEAREKLGYDDVTGGDSVLAQQQNYSLEALAKRDAKPDPFTSSAPRAPAPAAQADTPSEDSADTQRQLHPMEYVAALKQAVANARTH